MRMCSADWISGTGSSLSGNAAGGAAGKSWDILIWERRNFAIRYFVLMRVPTEAMAALCMITYWAVSSL
jgi:hypothetical protein